MKTCFKCKKEKPLEDFYAHKMMKDGRLSKCKDCTKVDVARNREKNIEYYREYDRGRTDDPKRVWMRKEYAERMKSDSSFVIKQREVKRDWINKNKIKRSAHILLREKLRVGDVKKYDLCDKCGSAENIEAHHEDYYKPLDVVWLCKKCHGARHREINALKRSGVDMSKFGF